MSVELLTEQHFEFLSYKGDCTGSSESTLVKMPHLWKSHVTAQLCAFSHLPVQNGQSIAKHNKIVSEYDQEIQQSQTADEPMAPRGKATQQSQDIMETN